MSIVDTAKAALKGSIKYVFGSSSISSDVTSGTGDCSSFTQAVAKANGISIGRTTNEQWTKAGTKVDKNDLQAGDLVFFKNTYNSGYTDGVSHVGIYVGDGKFIHNSSGAGKVIESDLNSGYYKEHYLGAKRLSGGSSTSTINTSNTSTTSTSSKGDVELHWWGDLIVLIVTVLSIALGIVFFLTAFSNLGTSEAQQTGKKLVNKIKKKGAKK